MKKHYLAVFLLVLVCAGAIAANFVISKPHADDKLIEDDFSHIGTKIEKYAQDRKNLPVALSDADLSEAVAKRSKDHPYAYRVVDSSTYELCATFKTEQKDDYVGTYPDSISSIPSTYGHKKGYQCFKARPYVLELRSGRSGVIID